MTQLRWMVPGLMTLIVAACSKSKSDNNSNSRMTLMTQAIWRYDTSGIDITGDGKIDLPDTIAQPCYKDNTYQFKTDSTVIVDEGATKCNSADLQTATYDWSISNGNPAIFKSDADPILEGGLTVQILNGSQLQLYKDTSVLGVSLRYILSLKH
ncbi:MAG TPA: hypothetical protein VHD83_04360 [Puia sp.]|nr:hypothetical protein [Puia sp.]